MALDPSTASATGHALPRRSGPPPHYGPSAADLRAVVATFAARQMSLSYNLIGLLDGIEQQELPPALLERIYAIDHVSSQVRRSAENLLLLAGGDVADPGEGPSSLLDVARAAQFESARYAEVKITAMPPGALGPGASDDVCHLLAELLDNAVTFSSPSTVTLLGRANPDGGCVLEISDTGVGIPLPVLRQLNTLLSAPPLLTVRSAQQMGMTIVAGLAQRHRLTVRLAANSNGGVTATVAIPAALILMPGPVHPVPAAAAAAPIGTTDRWGAALDSPPSGTTSAGLPRRVSTLRTQREATSPPTMQARPPDPQSVFSDFAALEEGERKARARGAAPNDRTTTAWEGPWNQ